MRIALVALGCPSGGMLHYLSQLANGLAGVAETHVFTSLASPSDRAYLDPGVTLHPTVRLNYGPRRLLSLLALSNPLAHVENARRIRAVRPDIVHFVTDNPANALLAALVGPGRVCFTNHDPTRHPGETSRLKDAYTRLTMAIAAQVVVHGDALRAELLSQGVPTARITVIPHGDYGFLKRYAPDVPEEPMLLHFGRLLPYKGVDVLCHAEQLLAERLDGYELVIAGEGDTAFFRGAIGPSGRVTVINRYQSDADTAALFQRARIVVLPYTQASQSGVAAIALAFGKPVIVTAVGGLPEAVGYGEAGVVVPAGDAEALAGAIATLWHDPAERARLGEAGLRRVRETIGWPVVAASHLAMYEALGGAALRGSRPAAQRIPGS